MTPRSSASGAQIAARSLTMCGDMDRLGRQRPLVGPGQASEVPRRVVGVARSPRLRPRCRRGPRRGRCRCWRQHVRAATAALSAECAAGAKRLRQTNVDARPSVEIFSVIELNDAASPRISGRSFVDDRPALEVAGGNLLGRPLQASQGSHDGRWPATPRPTLSAQRDQSDGEDPADLARHAVIDPRRRIASGERHRRAVRPTAPARQRRRCRRRGSRSSCAPRRGLPVSAAAISGRVE